MQPLLTISHLNKSFGHLHAVRDLSFHVDKGQLFAFLGVNGAGKSTTISMICGQLRPDSGTISINGRQTASSLREVKASLGVVFQDSLLDKDLSVEDNLRYRAALYGIHGRDFRKRYRRLASALDLDPLAKQEVRKLSGGQRRRVDIARAIIHEPSLLILDEPTTGLDPQTRRDLWNVIRSLQNERGITVLLTTHYMEEAAQADYSIIIDKGRIIAQGTPLDLKTAYAGDTVIIYDHDEKEVQELGLPYRARAGRFDIPVNSPAQATELILAHPGLFTNYEVIKGKMDDVFLKVVRQAENESAHQTGDSLPTPSSAETTE